MKSNTTQLRNPRLALTTINSWGRDKTLQASHQRSHFGRGSIMLLLLLSMLVAGTVFGQSFTPVEYNFAFSIDGNDFGNIDNNYWDRGDAVNPFTATPGTIFGVDLSFSGSTYLTSETSWSGSISCSGGYGAKPEDVSPQSIPLDYDTCARLKEWMYYDTFTQEEAKMKYDSLRAFIEKCAASDPKSYYVFGAMSGAVVRYAPKDTMRFIRYREWLVSVLYLNTTEEVYFCQVVSSIAGTYEYGSNYYPTLAYLAVLDYLRKHTNCTGEGHDKKFTADSLDAVNQGYDPTNLPPLDSLGLGFLLKLDAPREKPTLSLVYLGNASVIPNPMTGSTTLTYELLRSGFIGYTVHDALGNQVFARRSDFADAGKHEELIVLPASLSSGTYYLRLNVGFGEIRTIRMVVIG